MAVCSKCGAQIPDNTGVCPSCGAPQENGANQQAYVNGGNYMDPNDVQQNKVMAVLAFYSFYRSYCKLPARSWHICTYDFGYSKRCYRKSKRTSFDR